MLKAKIELKGLEKFPREETAHTVPHRITVSATSLIWVRFLMCFLGLGSHLQFREIQFSISMHIV